MSRMHLPQRLSRCTAFPASSNPTMINGNRWNRTDAIIMRNLGGSDPEHTPGVYRGRRSNG